MATLEIIGGGEWEDLLVAPIAYLMLGKSDCEHCGKWTDDLQAYLAGDEAAEFAGVRFGKMLLETPGLGGFKKANPWLAAIEHLPYNLLYHNGAKVKDWPGGGLDRLQNRLRRITGTAE